MYMEMTNRCLCDWKPEELEKHLEDVKALVSKPTHVCKNCGRASSIETILCKPVPLKC
ncbi:MAG: hypothetical protein ACYDEX_23810 [Mobilitalea sp.]